RTMTILLTPFMSCSAKLPIYSFLAAAFFPDRAALVMVLLYFGGIAVGILVALAFKGTLFKGEAVPFVMELPNYRLPGAKNVAHLLWDKVKDFLQRAFTIIFLATVIIWFLQTFDPGLNVVEDSSQSILALLAGGIAPVLTPLGLGDWRIATALLTGFIAKESVVATMGVLFGGTAAITAAIAPAAAAALLAFCLLYTPCVAAIASVKRELGLRWALAMVVGQCAIAWAAAFAVHALCTAIGV
ncbi:MAG: nucleoside recognition domain-containing protein, partial [Eggerthellaceae bacterium]|nr:nucleoside recognition domain-containing protein [Eggerthellaceae bacterium]